MPVPEADRMQMYKDGGPVLASGHQPTALDIILIHTPKMSMASSSRRESSASTSRIEVPADITIPKRRKLPWRRHVTPTERLLSHPYRGKGTENDPYIAEWLDDDEENPMTWQAVCAYPALKKRKGPEG